MPHNSYRTTWYLLPYAPTTAPDSSSGPQSEEGGPVPFFYCNLTAGTTMAGNRSGQRRASPDTSHNHCPHFTGTRDLQLQVEKAVTATVMLNEPFYYKSKFVREIEAHLLTDFSADFIGFCDQAFNSRKYVSNGK